LAPLLEIKNLHTEFRTGAGVVRAVDGVFVTLESIGTSPLSSSCFAV